MATINAAQYAVLEKLINSDDRVAFYVKLNEYTGSKTALLMAQISSSSSFIGGAAWAINGTYDLILPGYPADGVAAFSRKIAAADLRLIADRSSPAGYEVPTDQQMLVGAYKVWNEDFRLGVYFPGNSLIAANYLAAGNTLKAAEFAAYAVAAAPLVGGLGFGDMYWEAFNSPLNSGKSITEFLGTHPGSRVETRQGGAIQVVIAADGKTIGVFVDNALDAIPLATLQQLRGLVSAASIELAEDYRELLQALAGAAPGSTPGYIEGLISNLQKLFAQAETITSPLILDMDGNGVRTVGKTAGVHFDHDGNQFAELTGWVDAGDALLVRDINGNGRIDHGGELFGNSTVLANGTKAANGFAALAALDANADGRLDAQDAAFAQLRVWKDANGNARTDAGELLTLAQAGIRSVATGYTSQSVTDANGNQHLQAGTFTTTAGATRPVNDVWFAIDTARTASPGDVPVSAAIERLPDLAGFGGVRSLHQAMALDTTGRLQALVASFAAETNADLRAQVMTTLLYTWAGVVNIDPGSRAATQIYGNAIGDARKLATLETFLGEAYMGIWCWGTLDPNPHGRAAPTLIEAFDKLSAWYSAQLMAQTHFKALHEAIGLRWDAATGSLQFDVSQVVAILRAKYSADASGTVRLMTEFGMGLGEMGDGGAKVLETLRASGTPGAKSGFDFDLSQLGWLAALGSESANTLYGRQEKANSLYGLGGDDTLYGGKEADMLEGGSGADWLYGQAGDDTLKGGAGNDQLIGGQGNDTYWFLAGEGRDTINETSVDGRDVLRLGAGLSSAQTQVTREAMDLVLVFNATDSVRIVGYFSQATVEAIQFADGTVWDIAAVTARITYNGTAGGDYMTGVAGAANRINGLAGDDQIIGADKDDVLNGGDGNDSISGQNGADTLAGGKGADILSGGNGNDIYIYNAGDGADTIGDHDYDSVDNGAADTLRLGAGIMAAATQVGRSGNHLVLTLDAAGTDKVTVENHFVTGATGGTVETIEFADGTKWGQATVLSKLIYNGTASGDYLTALAGVANRINGLAGDDQIFGADKDDALNGGDGNDSISGKDGADTLAGGKGVDYLYGGNGNDTYLFNPGDGADTIGDHDYDNVDNGAADVLRLGAGITAAATQVGRAGNHLVLTLDAAGTNKVTVENHFVTGASGGTVETIEFADGTTWNPATVLSKLVYNGTAGGDYMTGLAGVANRINGLAGDDQIFGADKDDVLNGGKGTDLLSGGNGNDTYIYNTGDGADTIRDFDYDYVDNGTADALKLGAGITAAATQVGRAGSQLVLTFNAAGTDTVTVENHFVMGASGGTVETIEFADGTTWSHATVLSKLTYNGSAGSDYMTGLAGVANRINGLAGDDQIFGADKDDVLNGGDGSDAISGQNGADSLAGGKGADLLSGGNGNDVYIYNAGDGADTIRDHDYDSVDNGAADMLRLGAGITAAATQIGRTGNHLVLTFNTAGTDTLTVENHFIAGASGGTVEAIEFADGTAWNPATVLSKLVYNGTAGSDYMTGLAGVANRINGLAGDDQIFGADKDDVLNGGKGADLLSGGNGNDTYIYNTGDGTDTIRDFDYDYVDNGTADVLKLGAGITAAATQVGRAGSQLVLTFNAAGTDTVTVENHFVTGASSGTVETIEFADGTKWDQATVLSKLVYNGTAYDDYLTALAGVANRINGLAGNDQIFGADKDDVLNGGKGADLLCGGNGNDTYVYNMGDGADMIRDHDYDTVHNGTADVLRLGAGITAAGTQVGRNGGHLVLTFNAAGTDTVTVENHFATGASGGTVETIEFADGTKWDPAAVLSKLVYNGTAYDDYMTGLAGVVNRINGLAGNDQISGADKDDVLNGGKGADLLSGGNGNDAYIYSTGDGADTIRDDNGDYVDNGTADVLRLGAGMAAAGTQVGRAGSHLVLTFNAAGTDTVTVENHFATGASSGTVETIEFADGTKWDQATVLSKLVYNGTGNDDYLTALAGVANRINGLAGNDQIFGADKDDVLNGGAGSDALAGAGGNDTLDGGLGNDTLTGGAGADNFAFTTLLAGNVDKIADFNAAQDTIWLDNAVFTALRDGTLATSAFQASGSSAAASASSRVIFNTATGALLYDADGTGAATAVQFAAIALSGLAGPVTAADFCVI